jgi:hypothetical protein
MLNPKRKKEIKVISTLLSAYLKIVWIIRWAWCYYRELRMEEGGRRELEAEVKKEKPLERHQCWP